MRHDHIVRALEDDDGVDDLVGVENGRTLAIERSRFGQFAQQPIGVALFELVRVHQQAELVRDSVRADARFVEAGLLDQRLQHSETARAAAHDDRFVAVREARLRQIIDASQRIGDIINAPVAAVHVHIRFAIARAAAMIDLQHRITARGEKLHFAGIARIAL